MAQFSVNGKNFNFSGNNFKNVRITSEGVFVDGRKVTDDSDFAAQNISIAVYAPVYDLTIEGCPAEFHKEVGNINANGSVKCGNVMGDVRAGGSVSCGRVNGSVRAGGSVNQSFY